MKLKLLILALITFFVSECSASMLPKPPMRGTNPTSMTTSPTWSASNTGETKQRSLLQTYLEDKKILKTGKNVTVHNWQKSVLRPTPKTSTILPTNG